MATNDGYTPSPIGLGTTDTVNAIHKSHNLEPSTQAEADGGVSSDTYITPATLKGLSDYEILSADHTLESGAYVCLTTGVTLAPTVTAYTLTLPVATTAIEIIIMDGNGNAQERPIRVDGTIDGDVGGLVLDVNYFDIKLVWNGTDWSLGGK